MRFNSKDIADLVGGLLFGENLELVGVSSLENPKERTLIFCPSERDVDKAKDVKDTTLVISKPVEHPSYILVKDTKLALAIVLERLYPEEHPTGISEKAHVESSAVLGEDVYVGPFAYIGKNVVLERGVKVYPFSYIGDHSFVGENTVIFSGVHIYPRTVIGKNVRIHSGAVIGADGFGYHITKEGIIKLNHIGNVVIEDNVEIGANTTIDRALLDSTIVGKETKIDNLVMVAHNCGLGERNIIVGQVGLCGKRENWQECHSCWAGGCGRPCKHRRQCAGCRKVHGIKGLGAQQDLWSEPACYRVEQVEEDLHLSFKASGAL
jgi:UDP-3-O-[3-hydroxymyristoyl] glucosamine N-acyltransferase